MATTNKNKLTDFKSGQTIVTADFMNLLYQAPNGETASGGQAYGHVHDGSRLDGHAQKINLAEHVDGLLDPERVDGNILSQILFSSSGTGTLVGDALIAPDGPTGSVSLIAGDGIEIEADADTRTVTFKTAAEAVAYTLSAVTTTGGAGIRLTSNGTDQDVLIKQGSNVTIFKNLSGEIVITAEDTTYSISGQEVVGGALIRLTGSDAINDDLKLESGNNVTVQRISSDVIRISAQVPTIPLTNKGDILVYDNSGNARLPVGTDGQILSANSSATTGLQWINTVTIPLTTAGDLLVHNGTASVRLPVGSNGQFLKVNTSLDSKLEWSTLQVGSGDVIGPVTSTDNAVARYNLESGKIIQNSSVTIDDNGNLSTNAGLYGTSVAYRALKSAHGIVKYLDQATFNSNLALAEGRYYLAAPSNGATFMVTMPGVTSGAGLVDRVLTISNVGVGSIKINISNSDLFIIPFSDLAVSQIELVGGEWVELVAKPGVAPVTGLWIAVCGGVMPDYKPLI
jgi:hypothetical protein